MAAIKEYCVATVNWVYYEVPRGQNGTYSHAENFNENMRVFEEEVNEKLSDGWIPHGAPTFTKDWERNTSGRAYQALIRDRNINSSVLVVAKTEVVAEYVKPLRSSLRSGRK